IPDLAPAPAPAERALVGEPARRVAINGLVRDVEPAAARETVERPPGGLPGKAPAGRLVIREIGCDLALLRWDDGRRHHREEPTPCQRPPPTGAPRGACSSRSREGRRCAIRCVRARGASTRCARRWQ